MEFLNKNKEKNHTFTTNTSLLNSVYVYTPKADGRSWISHVRGENNFSDPWRQCDVKDILEFTDITNYGQASLASVERSQKRLLFFPLVFSFQEASWYFKINS